ncbi:hypothetical protein MMC25_001709 [Agyrium rufum]|nr:hypothetical protein [Agyrium rufum]
MSPSKTSTETMTTEMAAPPAIGHMMAPTDPDSPQNFPVHRKIYVSAVAFAFGFVVAFGATVYTPGISEIVTRFDVSMTAAILGLSLYLFGISFAPIITPHLSERFGRAPVYFASLPIFSLFILGAGLSDSFAGIAICRFFAGFFGGPCLVLIEGTFADVWGGDVTGTYYSVLGLSSYLGAGFGPLIGGFVFASKGYRWTQWVTLMMALAAYLLGIGMPETYHREVLRQRAKRTGISPRIIPAQSGATISQMIKVTCLTPVSMIITDPVVTLITLNLGFNFAVIFSWFISVPAVLEGVYAFDVQQVGLAFLAAVAGALLAAVTSIIIDRLTYPKQLAKHQGNINEVVEYRLYPAMLGCFFVTASLFWIGWTASPTVSWASPVIGTLLYVWGNLCVLIAMIAYLFEAYPSKGTLSALTASASVRLVLAAFLPLVIIQMFENLTGAWAVSLLGFISAAMIPIPFVLFKWGFAMRARSQHGYEKTGTAVPMMMAVGGGEKDLERNVTGEGEGVRGENVS